MRPARQVKVPISSAARRRSSRAHRRESGAHRRSGSRRRARTSSSLLDRVRTAIDGGQAAD